MLNHIYLTVFFRFSGSNIASKGFAYFEPPELFKVHRILAEISQLVCLQNPTQNYLKLVSPYSASSRMLLTGSPYMFTISLQFFFISYSSYSSQMSSKGDLVVLAFIFSHKSILPFYRTSIFRCFSLVWYAGHFLGLPFSPLEFWGRLMFSMWNLRESLCLILIWVQTAAYDLQAFEHKQVYSEILQVYVDNQQWVD